jgi:ArsR family transcriptional regulator
MGNTLAEASVLQALAALSQQARLRIFRALIVAGEAGTTPTTLAETLGLPANTLSFHLKALSHAALIRQQRQGRHLLYRAEFATMDALLGYLTENCCAGVACTVTPVSSCKPIKRAKRS